MHTSSSLVLHERPLLHLPGFRSRFGTSYSAFRPIYVRAQGINTRVVIGRTMPPVTDMARLVAQRTSIMAALRGPARPKRDLAGELDVSRSTVDRGVRELEAAGLIERTDGGLALTLPGRLALGSYETHTDELAGIERTDTVLAEFSRDLDLPVALFRNPVVDTPNRHAPHRPSDPLRDLLVDATDVKHYATGIRPEYSDHYWGIVDNGSLDVVATPEVVAESLQENRDVLNEAFESGRLTLAETTESRPYSIVIADDSDVCVLLYTDHALQVVVRNDNPDTVDWALEQFDDLRAAATDVGGHAAVE